MKISVVLGSPSKSSNSAKLAGAVVDALADREPEASRFLLNDLEIRGRQACFACKTQAESRVIKDDLAPALSSAA